MNPPLPPPAEWSDVLARLGRGELSPSEAWARLGVSTGIRDLGFARLDRDRRRRCGFPEFVYGAGKTPEELLALTRELQAGGEIVLVTRLAEGGAAVLAAAFLEGQHDPVARTFLLSPPLRPRGRVVIATAGTTDLPVAREAAVTCAACGCGTELVADVGVAGLHRLLAEVERLNTADAVIAVAGMEGALPSVIGGLVPVPVIAVPTSVGYGAALGGLTALLAMLNSCASGVVVMNIDNGFGAGCAAARILFTKYGPPAAP